MKKVRLKFRFRLFVDTGFNLNWDLVWFAIVRKELSLRHYDQTIYAFIGQHFTSSLSNILATHAWTLTSVYGSTGATNVLKMFHYLMVAVIAIPKVGLIQH